jgi:hypothetical protein
MAIASIISARGFDTMLTRDDEVCGSACAYIWLSGRHAVVQRGAALCFHQAYDPTTGLPNPEVNARVAKQIQGYGLTRNQAPNKEAACRSDQCTSSVAYREGCHEGGRSKDVPCSSPTCNLGKAPPRHCCLERIFLHVRNEASRLCSLHTPCPPRRVQINRQGRPVRFLTF